MKISKTKWVRRDIITKIQANYIILLGSRSTGKSFAVKEDLIKRCLENNEQFAYIRRYKEDCKQYMIHEYFSDIICDSKGVHHLEKWSKGEYNDIVVDKQSIYLAHTDDDGKVTKGQKLGRMFGLSWATHYKSLSFPEITTAVYEEFCTDGSYLSENEPNMFMGLISTIFRDKTARVYMVGNTVSRINPYISEWQLYNINKQKLGTIDTYKQPYTDEAGNTQLVKIAVYLTHSTAFNSGMFFGNAAKHIVGGMWESSEQPHLFGKKEDYRTLYSMVFTYDRAAFLMEFIQEINNSSNFIWFVSPKTTPIQKGTRLISNKYVNSHLATCGFQPLTEKEKIAFSYIKNKKICFSDNLTGTEFFQCYDAM